MKRNSSAIRLGSPRRRERSPVPAGLITAALTSSGTAYMLSQAFPSLPLSWWITGAWMFVISFILFLCARTRFGGLAHAVASLLLIISGAVFFTGLRGGLCSLVNDFLTWLPGRTGHITLPLAVDSTADVTLASLWAVALLAVLLSCSAVTAAPVIFAVLLGTAAGFLPPCIGTALFLSAVLLKCFTAKRPGSFSLVLASLVLCAGISPVSVPLDSNPASRLARTRSTLHSLRYDSSSNSMPEGQLHNLGVWNANDTPALAITLESPQKLYLRGFTGEKYTGDAWLPLEAGALKDSADTFRRLHNAGYYSQSSVAAALALTGSSEMAQLTVRNLSACSSRLYLPYALSGASLLDPSLIGDAYAKGREEASLLYCPGSIPDWFGAQSALSVSQRGEQEQAFLKLEEQYRSFAYDNYREVPAAAAEVLSRLLPDSGSPRTLSEVKDTILTVLETRLNYDPETVTRAGDTDFLEYTLERSSSGYSVHYATAATLMLRWFGVSARYVEGYFLSAEEASRYAAGEEIVLTEANAHAWAEYYLDGIGWIPFETTPGYIDDEELNAGPGTGLQGERFYRQPEVRETDVVQPSEIRERTGLRSVFRIPRRVLAYALPAFFVLIVAALLLCRRRRLTKALRRMREGTPRETIPALYGYARYLLAFAPKADDPGGSAAELNREALFSDHVFTPQQVSEMETYLKAVLARCRSAWNPLQRFWYRVIRCIY